MFKKIIKAKSEIIETDPMNLNQKTYDGFLNEAYKACDMWRYATFACIAIVGLNICGWVYAINLPDTAYHIIEIAPWGEAKSLGIIGKTQYTDIERTEQSINYYLREFIKNIRSISTDKEQIKDNLSIAFNYVTNVGYNLLQNNLKESDPFTRADNEMVKVVIQSILNDRKDAYQIDWYEIIYTADGDKKSTEQYRGRFNLYFAEPNEKQIIYNPLGIFVDEFSIQQIKN